MLSLPLKYWEMFALNVNQIFLDSPSQKFQHSNRLRHSSKGELFSIFISLDILAWIEFGQFFALKSHVCAVKRNLWEKQQSFLTLVKRGEPHKENWNTRGRVAALGGGNPMHLVLGYLLCAHTCSGKKCDFLCGRGGGRRGVGNQSGQRGEGGERYLCGRRCLPQATGSAAQTRERLSFLFLPARQQQQKKGFFSRPPSDALSLEAEFGVWGKFLLNLLLFAHKIACIVCCWLFLSGEQAVKVRAAPDRSFHLLVRNFSFSALRAGIISVCHGILHPPIQFCSLPKFCCSL